jgi:hypothetical protein
VGVLSFMHFISNLFEIHKVRKEHGNVEAQEA